MDVIKIEVGQRFYMPQNQSGEDRGDSVELHAATLTKVFSYHKWTHDYDCDCGFSGQVNDLQVRQWLTLYGTPPPKTEPLPSLDYTEESLISELAEMPIEAECAMHGPGCDFTEFDCEVVEKSHPDAYDYQDVLFEYVRKARELVARRQS